VYTKLSHKSVKKHTASDDDGGGDDDDYDDYDYWCSSICN